MIRAVCQDVVNVFDRGLLRMVIDFDFTNNHAEAMILGGTGDFLGVIGEGTGGINTEEENLLDGTNQWTNYDLCLTYTHSMMPARTGRNKRGMKE